MPPFFFASSRVSVRCGGRSRVRWVGAWVGFVLPTLAAKNAAKVGHRGSCFPTLATKRSRKDGARGSCDKKTKCRFFDPGRCGDLRSG
jgi:hypothetical protein